MHTIFASAHVIQENRGGSSPRHYRRNQGTKGMKVDEWAELLDRSPHTVHDLEAGRLKLSPALAAKMNYESGISIGWLMDGDPEAPAVSADGRPYTKAIYEEVQARKKHFAHVEEN